MINEERTFEEFGYYSFDIKNKRKNKVVAECSICHKEYIVNMSTTIHSNWCYKCTLNQSFLNTRGPFNIEYFQDIQQSITNAQIDELKTFNEFKYYSIDLDRQSNKYVYVICQDCGCIRKLKYQNIRNFCPACTQKGIRNANYGIPMSNAQKILISINRTGKNCGSDNHNYRKNFSIETRSKIAAARRGTKASIETRSKMSEQRQGDKHWNWQGGKSYEDYPMNFNETIKQEVRLSTNDCDFLTGLHKDICNDGNTLDVHHIDYDKQNTDIRNLIPLSKSNHTKTNHNREFWTKLFTNMQQTRYLLLDMEY